MYSYTDLLLIRLIVRLRTRGLKPKAIRIALDVLREIYEGDPAGWMKATLYVVDNSVVAITHRQEWNPLDVSKHGQKIALVFFPELIEELRRELVPSEFSRIEIDPEILGGAPVVKHTRIPTRLIAELERQGQRAEKVYPLSRNDVEEALRYEQFLEKAA